MDIKLERNFKLEMNKIVENEKIVLVLDKKGETVATWSLLQGLKMIQYKTYFFVEELECLARFACEFALNERAK